MTPAKKAPAAKASPKAETPARATKAAAAVGTAGASPASGTRRRTGVADGAGGGGGAASRAEKSAGTVSKGRGRSASPGAGKAGTGAPPGPYAGDDKFLLEQEHLLEQERDIYQGQAADLKAEADSLAQEREPGDVQFDEESGEGGTVTVDRERDLALSAQALAAVDEIDAAMLRIADRSYGACERCHQPIPKARLRALPYARLCVACKSGGLSRR